MFRIIPSPSNKTKCEICGDPIKKGEDRLDANLGSGNFDYHYHVNCFAEKYGEVIIKLLEFTDLSMCEYGYCGDCDEVNKCDTCDERMGEPMRNEGYD